jgi:hypothetical protein
MLPLSVAVLSRRAIKMPLGVCLQKNEMGVMIMIFTLKN